MTDGNDGILLVVIVMVVVDEPLSPVVDRKKQQAMTDNVVMASKVGEHKSIKNDIYAIGSYANTQTSKFEKLLATVKPEPRANAVDSVHSSKVEDVLCSS